MERVDLLGTQISEIDMRRAIATIERWTKSDYRSHYVCVATANSLVESRYDEDFRHIHNSASMVTPDGMPLVWLSHLLGRSAVDRVCGPDLMLKLFERSQLNGIRHFFYGGRPGVADMLKSAMIRRYPSLDVAGVRQADFERGSFRYRALTEAEDRALVEEINDSRPDVIWVGLGSPVQERWMARHVDQFQAVLIGVGAAFDFHAGIKRRAPHWMRRSGLEWTYRLAAEPRRLWKRYLVRNSQFVYLAARQLINRGVPVLD